MTTMKAAIYDSSKDAPKSRISVIETAPRPQPNPKSDDIMVRTLAAALNPLDYKIPFFKMMGFFKRGAVVGQDICAEVLEDKAGFHKGDIVFGFAQGGSLAEYTTVSPKEIALKPPAMPVAAAAGVGVAYISALQALRAAKVANGSCVAVIGASGGCGLAVTQLAKALGARNVIGICSSKNAAFVKGLGADNVVSYTDFPDLSSITKAVEANSLDAVVDTVSGSGPREPEYEAICRPWLKPGGMYTALNSSSGLDWLRTMMLPPQFQRSGYHLMLMSPKDTAKDLQYLAELAEKKQLAVPVHSEHRFSPEGVAAAIEEQRSRRARGKVVITFE